MTRCFKCSLLRHQHQELLRQLEGLISKEPHHLGLPAIKLYRIMNIMKTTTAGLRCTAGKPIPLRTVTFAMEGVIIHRLNSGCVSNDLHNLHELRWVEFLVKSETVTSVTCASTWETNTLKCNAYLSNNSIKTCGWWLSRNQHQNKSIPKKCVDQAKLYSCCFYSNCYNMLSSYVVFNLAKAHWTIYFGTTICSNLLGLPKAPHHL